MKQFFFLSGLPRSGSTVLTSILSENPELYASPNSALVELLVNVRKHLQTTEQTRAFMQPTQEQDTLLSIMEGMYTFTKKSYILDKSRAWAHTDNIELLMDILPEKPKFIALVRDLPSILASFISLIESNPNTISFVDSEIQKQGKEFTLKNRCNTLFCPGGSVYESWYTLKLAFDNGYADFFYLVEYDDFIAHPTRVLQGIYDFLEIPFYEHDLHNIVNTISEDDSVYNLPGMHKVRPVLQKISKKPIDVLGPELVQKYEAVQHFWRNRTIKTPANSQNPFVFKPYA